MVSSFQTILVITSVILKLSKSEDGVYTDSDFDVIKTFGSSFGVKCFAFVQNQFDVKIVKILRKFFKEDLFFVAMSSEKLKLVLDDASDRYEYFERKTVVVTKDHLNFTELLQKISGPHLLNWFVFTESFESFKAFYIPLNANFYLVSSKSDAIIVNKAYHLKPGTRLSLVKIGVWPKDKNRGLIFYKNMYSKVNFRNVTLNVLEYLSEEFCKTTKRALQRMECFHHEMINIIAHKLNFNVKIMECPERDYPYNYPNGSLSMLFIILDRREADISVASYTINGYRLRFYDFAWPTFKTRSMMFVKFRSHKHHWGAYLRPMDPSLWVAILSWIVITGLLVQIFEGIRRNDFKFRSGLILRSIKSVLVSLQMFCNQGLDDVSEWSSDRLVYLLSFFLFLVVYQGYSGHLISSLMVVTPEIPFFNIKGFFHDGTYRLITSSTGYHNYYIRKMVREYKAEDLMPDNKDLPNSSMGGIQKVCTGEDLAYVDFRENIVQYELPCKITEIPDPILYQNVGIGFPKNSPYKETIKREINLFHSTGILQRMRTNLFSYVQLKQKQKKNEEYVAVTLPHVSSIFFLLWLGVVVSWGVCLLEFIWHEIVEYVDRVRIHKTSKLNKNRGRLKMAHLNRKSRPRQVSPFPKVY